MKNRDTDRSKGVPRTVPLPPADGHFSAKIGAEFSNESVDEPGILAEKKRRHYSTTSVEVQVMPTKVGAARTLLVMRREAKRHPLREVATLLKTG
jgi:hypothetical protein